MEEDGARFLPVCYGYATTIRRAQGASLDLACIWFNQKRLPAGPSFGYLVPTMYMCIISIVIINYID